MNRSPRPVSAFSGPVLRRCSIVFCLGAAVLGIVVAAIYLQDRQHERTIVQRDGDHWAELESEILSREFKSVQADLLYLAKQDSLLMLLAGSTNVRTELERDYARFCRRKEVYDQIRCLDLTGQEVVRVNYNDESPKIVAEEQLQSKADRYYFKQALPLTDGETFVSPFDLNVEHGEIQRPLKPVIRFVTPVFDATGEKRGLLVLNYLGDRLLTKLTETSAGTRGAMYVLNADGEYLLSPDSADQWGWLLGHDRSFPAQFAEEWKQVSAGNQVQFHTMRGFFTCRRVVPPGGFAPTPGTSPPDQLVLVLRVTDELAYERSQKLLGQLLLMYAGAAVLVLGLSWYWAYLGTVRKYNEGRIRRSEARLRRLSSELLSAQEDERRRISRELHDQIGQEVTAVRLDLQSAAQHDDAEQTRTLLNRAIENTDQVLKELHEIASRVRPSVLDDLGLEDAVTSYLSEFRERTGIEVETDMDFRRSDLPRRVSENIYRILQESLTNIAKHAQTEKAWVKIEVTPNQLSLNASDAGIGFANDLRDTSRLGILGMQERADLLDGDFHLSSTPNEGTQIHVTIPLESNAKPDCHQE